jgi:phytoene dehydrogenase-like protein
MDWHRLVGNEMGVEATEIEAWARHGFPGRTQSPQRVGVVGAGMTGLVAALELQAAGYAPVV